MLFLPPECKSRKLFPTPQEIITSSFPEPHRKIEAPLVWKGFYCQTRDSQKVTISIQDPPKTIKCCNRLPFGSDYTLQWNNDFRVVEMSPRCNESETMPGG